MTNEEVLQKLRDLPRGERRTVADKTGLSYGYLSKIAVNIIPNPSAIKLDALREYFERRA